MLCVGGPWDGRRVATAFGELVVPATSGPLLEHVYRVKQLALDVRSLEGDGDVHVLMIVLAYYGIR